MQTLGAVACAELPAADYDFRAWCSRRAHDNAAPSQAMPLNAAPSQCCLFAMLPLRNAAPSQAMPDNAAPSQAMPLNAECAALMQLEELYNLIADMLSRDPSARPSARECLRRLGGEWVARLEVVE